MKIVRNIFKYLYFIYILFLFIMYTRVPDGKWNAYKTADNVLLENLDHFVLFFLLGSIATFINEKLFIYNFYIISALIISFFIEFIHLFLSYRGFEIIDLIFNITGCVFGIISLYYMKNSTWKGN